MKNIQLLNKTEIVKRLIALDRELEEILTKEDDKLELIIVGSSAFILKGFLSRATNDIDTYTRTKEEYEKVLKKYDISSSVYKVMNVCSNYKERMQKINLKLNNIDIFILGDYDLIISKLTSRPEDMEDLLNSNVIFNVDFDLLEKYLKTELITPCNDDILWYNFRCIKNHVKEEIGG